jgi:8-oxo-dGTP pyrophosphatase MutT (NUDIX family)
MDLVTSIENVLKPLQLLAPPLPWNLSELADLVQLDQLRDAAVLIGLIHRPNGWQVLLTQRTELLPTHAGQVSFPGGGVDRGDANLMATAIRETGEEVGIPADKIRVLGLHEPYATISHFKVTPVIALIDADYVATPNSAEVADVFEAPLQLFLQPQARRIVQREFRGKIRRSFAFEHAGYTIWGATAAMLVRLGDQLNEQGFVGS